MNVYPTKFFDSTVTNTILSYPNICHINSGSNWFRLLRLDHPTYPQLYKEFLSTLQLYWDDEEYLKDFYIDFEMGGVYAKLSIKDLNQVYGITRTQNRTHFREFSSSDFWNKIIVGSGYEPVTSRATHIHNPTLRYLYYVIANTVLGWSKDVDKVCPWDLFALWGLTVGNDISMVYFMLKHIQDVVIPYDALFVMGGLITPIVEFCGINLSSYMKYENRKVDLTTLFEHRMLSPLVTGGYLLHFSDRQPLRLPNLNRIRLNDDKNLKIEEY